MFGRRGIRDAGVALPVIIVPRSALEAEEDYRVPCAVVDFVNHALQHAMFKREELPPEAMQAFHVDYYIAQVNNGGHSQFAHNSHWHDYVIADIRAGLQANGCVEAQELFEDLCSFAEREPGQFMQGMEAAGFGSYPEFFKQLDKVFHAGLNKSLTKANRDWIASLDCLVVLDDQPYREAMQGLATRNPLHRERAEEARQRAHDSLMEDPIFRACQYVGAMSPEPVQIARWLSARPAEGPEGIRGQVIIAEQEDGRLAHVYLFPSVALVLDPYTREPQQALPMDLVQQWVHQHTGQYLPKELWR